MNRYKIMFVDDEADFLSAIQRALRKEPYSVTVAKSGDDALHKIGKNHFDLIVSDYKMPGMDGLALLEKVRANHPAVKAIMITAVADINIAVEALNNLNIDKFFLKPINIDALKPVLRDLAVNQEGSSAHDQSSEYPPGRAPSSVDPDQEPERGAPYYDGPVVECPFCEQGVGFRLHQASWTKLIPLLTQFRCQNCLMTFYKLLPR